MHFVTNTKAFILLGSYAAHVGSCLPMFLEQPISPIFKGKDKTDRLLQNIAKQLPTYTV
jgi:hypothetical protein